MAKSRHNSNVQGGNRQGHVTETPDMSHVRNIDVTHELGDVNVPAILKFVVALTVMTIVVFVLMWLLFGLFNAQEVKKESDRPRGPMAMTEQERLPPEPRLQAAPGFGINLENGQRVNLETREPEAEYRVVRDQWNQVLREGARDQSGKVVGLPIEDAMQKIIQGSSLPARTKELQEQLPGRVAGDLGDEMPTAASSGRVTEKRKQ